MCELPLCYQVFIVTFTKMVVWVITWIITPYKLLTLFQYFKGTKRFRWVLKLSEPICHLPDGSSTFLWYVQRNIMQTFVFGHFWAKRTSFNLVCGNAMAVCCSNAACFLVNCKTKLSYCCIPKLFYHKPLLSLAIHCWHSGIYCCVCLMNDYFVIL